jgi:hypothetical protein
MILPGDTAVYPVNVTLTTVSWTGFTSQVTVD